MKQTNVLGDDMNRVPEAMDIIRNAMIKDGTKIPGSYANSWHCNIAMMCHDAIQFAKETGEEDPHVIGNDAAARFMKLCFDVDTSA